MTTMTPQQSMTPATRTAQQLNTVKAMLKQSESAIASRLPKHLTPDRITKVALTAINKTPKLLDCTKESLLMSIMQAAELGLEPGSALGEGYLVPYGAQCQFIPGYRGLIALARRSGEIANIYAEAVYEGDTFEVELGLDPKLVHKPDWDNPNRDDVQKLTFVYAVARFKDGTYQFVVMSRRQVEGIHRRSKAGNSGPWVTDYEEMAKKTAIRRLAKTLPLSVEMAKACQLQAAAESGDFAGITLDAEDVVIEPQPELAGQAAGALAEPTATERPSRADALKAGLKAGEPLMGQGE